MNLLDQVVGNKENDMKLVSVLLLLLLSGGVMAAPDNLIGKKFEQLEQMIKDLEGQMTALTIENALLNDAVSDLERDLGDAEFEIVQLENTVAILSADGEGNSGEVTFVGVTDETFQGNARFNVMTQACKDKFGDAARMAKTLDRLTSPTIVDGSGWANPIDVQINNDTKIASDSSGIKASSNDKRDYTLNCRNWTDNRFMPSGNYGERLVGATIGNGVGAARCDAELPVACSAPI